MPCSSATSLIRLSTSSTGVAVEPVAIVASIIVDCTSSSPS